MNSNSRYLIDADVFIQAKNLHYRFEFCQAFWDWISAAHKAGLVYSIEKVLIPDAANVFKLKSIVIYDLLSQHATGNVTLIL